MAYPWKDNVHIFHLAPSFSESSHQCSCGDFLKKVASCGKIQIWRNISSSFVLYDKTQENTGTAHWAEFRMNYLGDLLFRPRWQLYAISLSKILFKRKPYIIIIQESESLRHLMPAFGFFSSPHPSGEQTIAFLYSSKGNSIELTLDSSWKFLTFLLYRGREEGVLNFVRLWRPGETGHMT